MIKVLFFGPIADRMQMRETQLEFTRGMTMQDAIAHFSVQHPSAFSIVAFIAVNQTQIHDKQMVLHDNDEIAFMAKYAGG
ncbi:ThiS family protein [mine drainage metagenome]|uniref:ThiS family protein n=1 Tax=mine drainage metagenome TaxID=410659 RepID=A0A1J5S2R5_9ZZZZ